MAQHLTYAPFDGDYLLADVYTSPEPDIQGPFRESRETPAQQVQRFEALRVECPSYVENLFAAGLSLVQHAAEGELEALHELVLELRGDELTLHHPRAALYAAVIKGNLHAAEYLRRRGLPIVRAHDSDPGTNLYEQLILNWLEEQESKAEEASESAASEAGEEDEADPSAFIDRMAKQIVDHASVWRRRLHLHDAAFADATKRLYFSDGPKDFAQEEGAPNATRTTTGMEHKETALSACAPAATNSAAGKASEGAEGAEGEEIEESKEQEEVEVEVPLVPAPTPLAVLYIASVLRQPIHALRKHDGYTPLHLFAEAGWPEAVAALLLLGADVHSVSSSDNDTPLSAAQRGRRETGCDAILEAAATVGVADEAAASRASSSGLTDDVRLARGRAYGSRKPTAKEVTAAKAEKRRYDLTESLIRSYGGVRDWKLAVRRGNEKFERRQMAASLSKLAAGGLSAVSSYSAGPDVSFSASASAGAGAAGAGAGAGGSSISSSEERQVSKRNFKLSTSDFIAVAGGEDEQAGKEDGAATSVSTTMEAGAATASSLLGSPSPLSSFSGGFNPEAIRRAYANAASSLAVGSHAGAAAAPGPAEER